MVAFSTFLVLYLSVFRASVFLYLYSLDADKLVGLESEAQNLVNCLQILEVLTSAVHEELLSKVTIGKSLVSVLTKAGKLMLTTIQG